MASIRVEVAVEKSRLAVVKNRLDVIKNRMDVVQIRLDVVNNRLAVVKNRLAWPYATEPIREWMGMAAKNRDIHMIALVIKFLMGRIKYTHKRFFACVKNHILMLCFTQ